jgi:hypothetical protein
MRTFLFILFLLVRASLVIKAAVSSHPSPLSASLITVIEEGQQIRKRKSLFLDHAD